MAIRVVSNLMPFLRHASDDIGILFSVSPHDKKRGSYSVTPKNIEYLRGVEGIRSIIDCKSNLISDRIPTPK
jgi:hypothetical protein